MEIPVSALAAASGPPTCEVIVINKPAAHLIEVGIFYEITIIRTSMVYGGHLAGHVRGSGQLTPVVPQSTSTLVFFQFQFVPQPSAAHYSSHHGTKQATPCHHHSTILNLPNKCLFN